MPAYRLMELKKVPAPKNMDNYNWYYYIISNEMNQITGYREGSKKEIETYLKETLCRLNKKFKISQESYQKHVRKAYEPGVSY
ncbi:MAG: hypothetical protein P8Y24_03840 [Gammaproteobacteria bacterium]